MDQNFYNVVNQNVKQNRKNRWLKLYEKLKHPLRKQGLQYYSDLKNLEQELLLESKNISSKGKIVHFSTEKKLPGSSCQYLNLSVTWDMVPATHLLVYYIITGEQTAELVSDSICLNIDAKCGIQLQVRSEYPLPMYSSGQAISLTPETLSESWVALSAVNSAEHGIQKTLERELRALDKSDQDSGAGGGRNNAEVFQLAGLLTILTNVNSDDSQENGLRIADALQL
ncbi:complement C5-like [Orycteropus afer afer]|uniref:Complement C5-like n=1 Tax=Orycteropus afer afer TaxID=1230840 RepID=A0AC54Z0Y2_ORYAF|nr:complement C5-like [Orycteropus afer afer]